MKVAILTPWIKIGGISQFVLMLGEYLRDHEYDVTVVTLYEQGDRWERLAEVGVRAVHFPIRWQDGRLQHALRLSRYLARQQFDLVVANIGIANWAGYQCLGFLPDDIIAMVVLHGHTPWGYQAAADHCDAWNLAVAVSPQVQQTAAARMPGKQVRLIPNAVRSPNATELAQRVVWATPQQLLFVGRLEDRHKGIFQLPEILRHCLAQNLNVTLTVVGDGSDRQELEQRFAEAGVANQVEMRGAVSHADVYAAMQTHHILLLPSSFEGDPLVLKEALINGCVPVASRLPGITDAVIREGLDGLMATPGDSLSFASQVAALSDPLRWQTFSQAGMAHARTRFSTQIMGEQYDSLLRELVAGTAPLAQPRHHGYWRRLTRYGWRDVAPSGPLAGLRRLWARYRHH